MAAEPLATVIVPTHDDWDALAAALGLPIAYIPEMRVRHPARASFEALAVKRTRVAGGKSALHDKGPLRARLSLLRLSLPSPSVVRSILAEPGLSPAMRLDLLGLDSRLRRAERNARRTPLTGAEP